MSYFIPVSTTVRDHFKDELGLRYLKVIIDPDGTPITYTPVQISCEAAEDYQKWNFRLKNRSSYSVGQHANEKCEIFISHDNSAWVKIFTGQASDDGFRRTLGSVTDDYVTLELVDPTKRKGTKRKPDPVFLSGFKISNPTTPSTSILHYLAGLMGVDVSASEINYTKTLVELGSETAWAELKRLQNTFHADMFFDKDGELLFISPFDTGYSAPTAEWTFQGDPSNSAAGNASRIKGKINEAYLPVRCNRAITKYDDLEVLSARVIYKNTENYEPISDQISIELAPGDYWPGPGSTDLARLNYVDPETGEKYPFATPVTTPTIGAVGSGSDIEYTGGTLTLVSFNGSTSDTSQNADSSEIILRNTGGSTCTIKKLTIRGTPYRIKSAVEVKHIDPAVTDEVDYVDKDVDGKYVTSASQVFDTLYLEVEEGKGRPRRFGIATFFMPWIQRGAIVNVQLPGESAVRCKINTYRHRNTGKTLQFMRTEMVVTELGTYTPTGSPVLSDQPQVSPAIAKLNSISPNAGATYRSASTSAPTNPQYGDWWYQTDTKLYKRYTGSAWEDVGASPLEKSSTAGVDYENASGNVKILSDGTIKAINGDFSGDVTCDTLKVNTGVFAHGNDNFYGDADEEGHVSSGSDKRTVTMQAISTGSVRISSYLFSYYGDASHYAMMKLTVFKNGSQQYSVTQSNNNLYEPFTYNLSFSPGDALSFEVDIDSAGGFYSGGSKSKLLYFKLDGTFNSEDIIGNMQKLHCTGGSW